MAADSPFSVSKKGSAMSPRVRLGLIAVLLLVAGVLPAAVTENYKFAAPAGTTVHELGEHNVQVTSSAPVTIYLVIEGDQVEGAVEPQQGSADVSILLLGDPGQADTLLFQGRVKTLTWFEQLIPHETGHGEG